MPSSKHDLESIFNKTRTELVNLQNRSQTWYLSQVRTLSSAGFFRPERVMKEAKNKVNSIIPGNLYFFHYDPKFKETLPYYDTFPLVLPFRQVKGGFFGLNLHYLPYNLRAKLFNNLLKFRSDTSMDENTRLKFSWRLINGVAQFEMAAPCVKHYLYPHVQSQFKKIDSQDWATAIMLPVETFKKATASRVRAESVKIIRGK